MILSTTESISGKELETLGLVKGSTIQTVNAVRDIGAGLKTLVGGELTRYNEMMNDARARQWARMPLLPSGTVRLLSCRVQLKLWHMGQQ